MVCRPHAERACDLHSRKPTSLDLVIHTAQIAASFAFKKFFEVYTLLQEAHTIIKQHGDNILSALKLVAKTRIKNGSCRPSAAEMAEKGLSACTILLLSDYLMGKYSLTSDRISAVMESADKRRAEDTKDIQASPANLFQFCFSCQELLLRGWYSAHVSHNSSWISCLYFEYDIRGISYENFCVISEKSGVLQVPRNDDIESFILLSQAEVDYIFGLKLWSWIQLSSEEEENCRGYPTKCRELISRCCEQEKL